MSIRANQPYTEFEIFKVGLKDFVYPHCIADLDNPSVERFNEIPAHYAGIQVSHNGKILYVSDWKTVSLLAIDEQIDEQSKKVRIYHEECIGSADLAYEKG